MGKKDRIDPGPSLKTEAGLIARSVELTATRLNVSKLEAVGLLMIAGEIPFHYVGLPYLLKALGISNDPDDPTGTSGSGGPVFSGGEGGGGGVSEFIMENPLAALEITALIYFLVRLPLARLSSSRSANVTA